jgi:glycosyltransferase involved in cell wall biosynthesis
MSVESMRHAIETIATDDALRSDMIARGHRRWREFSWARSARETFAVYQNFLEQGIGRTPHSETHGVHI